MTSPSLRDLRLMAKTPAQQISLGVLVCPSYRAFLRLLDRAVDYIASELSKNPQQLQNLSENQITIQIVRSLKMLGFLAHFELTTGGHCDIVVEWGDTGLWRKEI